VRKQALTLRPKERNTYAKIWKKTKKIPEKETVKNRTAKKAEKDHLP